MENGQMEDIKSYENVHVNIVEDLTPFRDACAPVYDQFKDTLGEYVDKINAAK